MLRRKSRDAFRRRVRLGIPIYRRHLHLAALVPVRSQWALEPESEETSRAILSALKVSLRAMVKAERDARWTYDQNRHAAILSAIGAEIVLLKSVRAGLFAARDAG